MSSTNGLAYSSAEYITPVKSFTREALMNVAAICKSVFHSTNGLDRFDPSFQSFVVEEEEGIFLNYSSKTCWSEFHLIF
jgi:hypothetical protein